MCAQKATVFYSDPPVNISIRVLVPSDSQSPIVSDEVYVVTYCHPITYGYEVRLAAKSEQASAEDFNTFAYFDTLSAEVLDRVLTQFDVFNR